MKADSSTGSGLHRHFALSDLRGAAQLAMLATEGVTTMVEGVHHSVLDRLDVSSTKLPTVTRDMTRFVYGVIHQLTRLTGKGAQAALQQLEPLLAPSESGETGTPERRAALAALNGLLGDRLVAHDNPLAIPMNFYHRNRVLDGKTIPPGSAVSGRILLLIHGLCMSDLGQDRKQGPGLGETLASSLGYSPISLRYNSGLHISENGRELAARLEKLLENWPTPVEELSIVAHSMGGLVARSAAHYAGQQGLGWTGHLRNLVFLGTPHHGAPLEKGGNWMDALLASTPYTRPFSALGRVRSAGITDLRYGSLLDDDWRGRDRFKRHPDDRQWVPLPKGVACHAVAGALSSDKKRLANHLTGDGLVPVNSALGLHDDPEKTLSFPESSRWVAYEVGHLGLLNNPKVTSQLFNWLSPDAARPTAP